MRSTKTKEQIYRQCFSLFTKGEIPNEILYNYMNDSGDGYGTLTLQLWIIDNMKNDLSDWCTGIGVIEAVKHLYKTAYENGNLDKPAIKN